MVTHPHCFHCERNMSKYVHVHGDLHDMFLFPHGKPGCSGVTEEDVLAAEKKCQFCPKWTSHFDDDDEELDLPFRTGYNFAEQGRLVQRKGCRSTPCQRGFNSYAAYGGCSVEVSHNSL